MTEILSVGAWRTNAEMIRDVAQLGYLDDQVLDVTFGEGNFWSEWQPQMLTASDLHKPPSWAAVGFELYESFQWDYRALPCGDSEYDAVVFDPPYKLNGTPATGKQDELYGTTAKTSRVEVLDDIVAGALECYRVTSRILLVKCQDQVEGGRMRWQTDLVTRAIEGVGGRKVDRFEFGAHSDARKQPQDRKCRRCGGTGVDPEPEPCNPSGPHLSCRMRGCERGRLPIVQRTARHAGISQLLVFEKPKRSRT